MAEPVNNPETLTLLQYALGIGTAIGAALAAFFGVRSKTSRRGENRRIAQDGAAPLEVYWDGPIVACLAELKKIAVATEHIAALTPSLAQLREELAEKISKSRHNTNDTIHEYVMQFEKEITALETRLREAERLAAVLNERVGGMQDRGGRRT